MKKANVFLILYPIVLLAYLYYNGILISQFQRNGINWIWAIIFLVSYFIVFACFITVFYEKKVVYSSIAAVIGAIELLFTIITCYINPLSFPRFLHMSDYYNIFLLGQPLVLYIRLIMKKL